MQETNVITRLFGHLVSPTAAYVHVCSPRHLHFVAVLLEQNTLWCQWCGTLYNVAVLSYAVKGSTQSKAVKCDIDKGERENSRGAEGK